MLKESLHNLERFESEAGGTWRCLRSVDAGFAGFSEVYFSWINPGHTKAWKRHKIATCNFVVPVGKVTFMVETEIASGIFESVTIGPETYSRLTVTPGRWFGFRGDFANPSLVVNVSSEIHDDDECENLPMSSFSFETRN
jgi:dTDP-4-dehydrorhamnose 3,5-epimerase